MRSVTESLNQAALYGGNPSVVETVTAIPEQDVGCSFREIRCSIRHRIHPLVEDNLLVVDNFQG
jgi:hypothetical protein